MGNCDGLIEEYGEIEEFKNLEKEINSNTNIKKDEEKRVKFEKTEKIEERESVTNVTKNDSIFNPNELNIDSQTLFTQVDDFHQKINSKSKLKDILYCDESKIENKIERAKVQQIKDNYLKVLDLEDKLNALRAREKEVLNKQLDMLVQTKVEPRENPLENRADTF